MSLLDCWRSRGWQEIDGVAYQTAHAQFGGSVISHPQFIQSVSSLTQIPLRYFGKFDGSSLQAAVPTWNSHIAGSKPMLKRAGQYDRVDLGNMEIILPMQPQAEKLALHFKGKYLSALHLNQIKSLKQQPESLSLLKSYSAGDFSKKFLYNRSRELRLLEEAGGTIRNINEFSSAEIASWYLDLFEKRWQKKPRAHQHIALQLDVLKDFLTGRILFLQDRPIAIQLLFVAESPQWISFEFINAGVDPEYHQYSPGSILTFLNTQMANQLAQTQAKQLRYSFGRSDADYKSLWCHQALAYCI